MRVCVLLSTYNGERFLKEQLESLTNQEGVEVSILVRDDGSTDSTCKILDKWQNKGLIKWYSGPNKGFAMSFMDLLEKSGEYDYYAFCDQDDIWLPNKLEMAINSILTLKSPVKLYCSNTFYYKNGENMGFIKREIPNFNLHTSLIQNIATGCTILFNRELRDIMAGSMPERIIAHDFWAYQCAMIFGEVFYDNNSYIYYRQHDNNQIGAKTSQSEIWQRRIKSFFCSGKPDGRSLQAKELLRCFGNTIGSEQRTIISKLADYKESIFSRIGLIFDCKYTMGHPLNNILFRLKILSGKL